MTVDVSEKNGWQDLMAAMMPLPDEEPPVQSSDPVQEEPSKPVENETIPAGTDREATLEQKKEMLVLAEKMDGPGADYLRLMSASPATYSVAQEVIERAKAFIGGK